MTPQDNLGRIDMDDTLLYLGPDDVLRAVQEVDAVDTVREALSLHSMPALVEGDLSSAGVKVINANTANPASGLPRASGLTLLFDVQTAKPRCVMSAAAPLTDSLDFRPL